MTCCICSERASSVGLLCEPCHEALIGPVPITREQIRAAQGTPSDAVLIDVWGGPHRLSLDTTVGRALDPALFSIFDSSISRVHAVIVYRDNVWTIQDLASSNGTLVNDVPATIALPLRTGDHLRIGLINFFFAEHAAGLDPPVAIEMMGQTARPSRALAPADDAITFKLSEPMGGGGGVVEISGKPVHLTLAQYELVTRLVTRRLAGSFESDDTRGFISADELVAVLSLDSLRPDDDNIRQLVRRVRRVLEKAGVGDLIESRYRLGYRLAVQPRLI